MARLLEDGKAVEEAELGYAGVISTYSGSLTPPSSGEFTLEILAMDPGNVNFGRVSRELKVPE